MDRMAWDHPRLRGEQAPFNFLCPFTLGSPPLARGTAPIVQDICDIAGITPACAGNRYLLSPVRSLAGSPPLARGTDRNLLTSAYDGRITPACAGNSAEKFIHVKQLRDHPRLRGEQTKKRLVVPCILQYCFSFFNQFFVDMFC